MLDTFSVVSKASTFNVTRMFSPLEVRKFTQEMIGGMRAHKNKILAVRHFKVIGGPPRRGNVGKHAYLLTYLFTYLLNKLTRTA
jgi:hypothetical protein